jgi:hypothetical protein
MKTKPASKTSRFSRSESGVALIITLAALVLVTMAAVAFFSRATGNRLVESSRTNQVQSTQLARTGVDYVTTQFLSDIVGNSTSVNVGNSTIYRPKNATNMVPVRAVHSDLTNDAQFQNLVLQSLGGNSSAAPAPNGRSLGTTAWNAPMLLGGDGFISNNTVPTWIYVNRDGSTSSTANATTTIGRFAYNAYNLGGLLDINAFGYGGAFSANNTKTKGTPASVALDALPGISSTATKSNNSLSWPPTWRIPGDWAAMSYDPAGNSTNSLKFYMGSGWRIPFSQNGTAAHRFFATRQDLIRYAQANPATFTANGTKIPALQYLTHWSRDVDLPTHEPPSGRPKVLNNLADGGNDAFGLDDALNPSLLTVTNMDGNATISKRFPLSRLAMVATPVPPASPTASAADILKYFGLTWDGLKNLWKYDHGDSSDILPLSDIPANRDPDFVELLKAAIAAGSLGKQFGIPYPYSNIDGLTAIKGGQDGSTNYQLIQIAANIIDQYDTDGYPTRIQFDNREFYGTENLPQLFSTLDVSYRIAESSTDYVKGFEPPDSVLTLGPNNSIIKKPDGFPLYVWMIQPQIWNPHLSADLVSNKNKPIEFRITATTSTKTASGEAMNYPLSIKASPIWNPGNLTTDSKATPLGKEFPKQENTPFTNNFNSLGGPDCSSSITYNGSQYISFDYSDSKLYREPTYLSKVGYPSGSNANGVPNNKDMTTSDKSAPDLPDTVVKVFCNTNIGNPVTDTSKKLDYPINPPESHDAIGFVVGYLPGLGSGWKSLRLAYHIGFGGPLIMELQYRNGLDWWTIARKEANFTPSSRNFDKEIFLSTRVDPRNDRWGSFYYRYNSNYLIDYQFRNFSITPNPVSGVHGKIYADGTGGYALFNESIIAPGWYLKTLAKAGSKISLFSAEPSRLQRNSSPIALEPNRFDDPFRYTDPDGVQRRGVSAYADEISSEGWPMHQNNSSSRPVVLDRPFQSISELGNVFRGTPWRNLDLMTPESGDRVLLDLFTLEEAPADNVVGGRVNLNMASLDVLTALIQGAGMVNGTSTISKATASDMALEFKNYVTGAASGQGYLKDRSEIVGRWVAGTTYAGAAQEMAAKLTDSQKPLPRNRDTIVASLADVGTVRTWNFLIDVVAQSGSVVNGQFIPQGEARLWDCVAIDRFTARVVARSSESINN